jgi:hypothetical protein
MSKRAVLPAWLLTLALFIVACGGGSDGTDLQPVPHEPAPEEPAPEEPEDAEPPKTVDPELFGHAPNLSGAEMDAIAAFILEDLTIAFQNVYFQSTLEFAWWEEFEVKRLDLRDELIRSCASWHAFEGDYDLAQEQVHTVLYSTDFWVNATDAYSFSIDHPNQLVPLPYDWSDPVGLWVPVPGTPMLYTVMDAGWK